MSSELTTSSGPKSYRRVTTYTTRGRRPPRQTSDSVPASAANSPSASASNHAAEPAASSSSLSAVDPTGSPLQSLSDMSRRIDKRARKVSRGSTSQSRASGDIESQTLSTNLTTATIIDPSNGSGGDGRFKIPGTHDRQSLSRTTSSKLLALPTSHLSSSQPPPEVEVSGPAPEFDFSQFKTPANAGSLSPAEQQSQGKGRQKAGGGENNHGRGRAGRQLVPVSQSQSLSRAPSQEQFSPVPVPRVRQKDRNLPPTGRNVDPSKPKARTQTQSQSRSRNLKENAPRTAGSSTTSSRAPSRARPNRSGGGGGAGLGLALASPFHTRPPSVAGSPTRSHPAANVLGVAHDIPPPRSGVAGNKEKKTGQGQKAQHAFYRKSRRTMSDAEAHDEEARADRGGGGGMSRDTSLVLPGGRAGTQTSGGGGSRMREAAYSQSVIHSPTKSGSGLVAYEGPGIVLKSSSASKSTSAASGQLTRQAKTKTRDAPPHASTTSQLARPNPKPLQSQYLSTSSSNLLDLSRISAEDWVRPAKVLSRSHSYAEVDEEHGQPVRGGVGAGVGRGKVRIGKETSLEDFTYPPNETPPVWLDQDGGDDDEGGGGGMQVGEDGWIRFDEGDYEMKQEQDEGEEMIDVDMDLTLQPPPLSSGLGLRLDTHERSGSGSGWLAGSAFGTGSFLELGNEGSGGGLTRGSMSMRRPSTPPRSSSFFSGVPLGTSTPSKAAKFKAMEKGKKREEVVPSAPNTPDRAPMAIPRTAQYSDEEEDGGSRRRKGKKVVRHRYTPNSIFSSSFVDATTAFTRKTRNLTTGEGVEDYDEEEETSLGLGALRLGKDSLFDDDDDDEEEETTRMTGRGRRSGNHDRSRARPVPIPSGLPGLSIMPGATGTTPQSPTEALVSKRNAQNQFQAPKRAVVGRNRAGTIKASDYGVQGMKLSVSAPPTRGVGMVAFGQGDEEDEEEEQLVVGKKGGVAGRARSGTIRASAVNPAPAVSKAGAGGRARSGTIRASSFSVGDGVGIVKDVSLGGGMVEDEVMNMDMDIEGDNGYQGPSTSTANRPKSKSTSASFKRKSVNISVPPSRSSSPDAIDFLRLRGGSAEDEDDPASAVRRVSEEELKETRGQKRKWSKKLPLRVKRRLGIVERMNISIGDLSGDELDVIGREDD